MHATSDSVSRYTVCISGGLSTPDAHRGSDFLHEAMHLYLQRLEEANVLGWYRVGYPGKAIAPCNAYLPDYLAKQYAAPKLHYVYDHLAPRAGCGYSGSDLEAIAGQLIAEKSPFNDPAWR